jgi:peptidoglycan/LPS O-acetylase OafA/YrhL
MKNKGLTSFRALAFLAVFLFHSNMNLFDIGYIGVQAFFVLSGFLLTPILMNMKRDLDARGFFKNFYGRRVLRIFPLYYLYLGVVALFSLLVIGSGHFGETEKISRFMEQLPWAATYTFDFFNATVLFEHTPLLAHFWSLAVEEQFYLIWPFLIFFTKPKHLKTVHLAIIFIGPLLRFITGAIAAGYPAIFNERIDLVVYVLPFSHLDAFAMGGYFALYQDASNKSRASTWWLMLSAILLGFLTTYISTREFQLSSLGYPDFMRGKYVWGYSVLNFVFAYMLLQIGSRKFLPFLFENRILYYLGEVSYGLYVYHYGCIWLVKYFISGEHYNVRYILSFVLTILVSIISYELFEKRFMGLKDKFFPKEAR